MVKFTVEARLACPAAMYISDKDSVAYKTFHVRPLPAPDNPPALEAFVARSLRGSERVSFFTFVLTNLDPAPLARPTPKPRRVCRCGSSAHSRARSCRTRFVTVASRWCKEPSPGVKLPRIVRPHHAWQGG